MGLADRSSAATGVVTQPATRIENMSAARSSSDSQRSEPTGLADDANDHSKQPPTNCLTHSLR